jgi:hypothetical protein
MEGRRPTQQDRISIAPAHSATGLIFRWIAFALLGVIAVAALIYVGDYVTFLVRGQPLDQVNVTRYMAAPLKGNKTELLLRGLRHRSPAPRRSFRRTAGSPAGTCAVILSMRNRHKRRSASLHG